jgi:two-component system, cell cycle sensor histidine kinase and response regulator CckA
MDGPMNTIRVLVVSDNPDDVVLVEELLSTPLAQTNYVVENIADFQGALRALVSDSYDVYLLDYHVPGTGITGVDLIQRAYAGGCTSPIILLTQISDDMIQWAAEHAGAADVLHKTADLCPHPDCPMHRNKDTPHRLLARSIRYAVQHFQQLKMIQKQLDGVQKQLADVHRKLNRG